MSNRDFKIKAWYFNTKKITTKVVDIPSTDQSAILKIVQAFKKSMIDSCEKQGRSTLVSHKKIKGTDPKILPLIKQAFKERKIDSCEKQKADYLTPEEIDLKFQERVNLAVKNPKSDPKK